MFVSKKLLYVYVCISSFAYRSKVAKIVQEREPRWVAATECVRAHPALCPTLPAHVRDLRVAFAWMAGAELTDREGR